MKNFTLDRTYNSDDREINAIKKVLGKSIRKRSIGRPSRRWEDNTNIREIGYENGRWT
jgi:hypothetical protein